MVFDKYDFELMRLCGACRYIPTGVSKRFNVSYINASVISTLRNSGFMKMQKDKKSYKLTFAGKEVLADMGYSFPEDSRMNLKRKTYQRKLKNALWNITLHLAGIDIFSYKTVSLNNSDIGYVSSLILRADNDIRVLAATRFLGILKIYDTAYIPYFVEGQDDWIMPNHEKEVYKSQVGVIKSVKNVKLILTGDTLEELWKHIHPVEESLIKGKGMRRFDEALEEIASDYLLVPSSQNGVTQLDIIKICRYREQIAKALGCKTEKIFNLSECDGFKENVPYVVAVDFNVQRIVRALRQIERYNKNLVPRLCCLTFQRKTLTRLLKEYKAQNVLILTLDEETIYKNIFKGILKEPVLQTPYTKNGGGYINANQKNLTKAINEER